MTRYPWTKSKMRWTKTPCLNENSRSTTRCVLIRLPPLNPPSRHPQVALERIRDTIQLDPSLPWTETLVLSYPNTIDVDVEDDLNRELALYVPRFL